MADPLRQHIVGHKWKGLLVEPLKGKFAQLLQNYAHTEGLIFENAAISKAPGPATLFRVKEGHATEPWQEGLATFCPEKNALRNLPEERIDQESVDCITLMDLLKKHHIAKLDLLQIDVEGYDFEIIKLIDFSAIEPVLINYEHCNLRSHERRQARRYLRERGYVLIQREYDTSAVLPRYADRLLGRSSVGL
ncbi:MAG: FkbM family methyltransferase [Candidatus Hydrogenedentes bacterium]|nr:FkbM family methyltransferase [Candidatus Hydrogenedentota bacterium]